LLQLIQPLLRGTADLIPIGSLMNSRIQILLSINSCVHLLGTTSGIFLRWRMTTRLSTSGMVRACASYSQIQSFLADYSAQALQLPTNYRCPPAIVEAANRLVVYNAQRTSSKEPLIAGKMEVKYPAAEHIQLRACIGQYSFRRSVMGMLQCDLHWYLFRFCSDWITGRERDDVVQRGGDAHLFALSLF
jgi:hypothetical protein